MKFEAKGEGFSEKGWGRKRFFPWTFGFFACLLILVGFTTSAFAQSSATASPTPSRLPVQMNETFQPTEPQDQENLSLKPPDYLNRGPDFWTSPEGMVPTLQIMLLLTVLTLAPAIIIMTTSFVRIVVVLSILRQAIGTAQLPPSQVITALSLFITLLIMSPVWQRVYQEAVLPYTEKRITLQEATARAEIPIRAFMCDQIDRTDNTDSIWLFMRYIDDVPSPENYGDVPWRALLPAFMLSELKTAFLIGFKIFLPFLILDMVISSVMVSMGMMMLPPAVISLPFKLMLFVLLDGWNLVIDMLIRSFTLYSSGGG